MSLKINYLKRAGFEEIATCEHAQSGLKAIIAIHSTRLGPALGGIRMFPYPNQQMALEDAMRLAKAMSYKSAASDLKLGGGKGVIIGDPSRDKTTELLTRMGEFVDALKGRYYCAKDAGIVTEDLVEISKVTKFVTGLPASMGGSGDPSPWTALGILEGMRACLKEKRKKSNFKNIHIAIQGIGHVGFELAKLLLKEGAHLTIADIDSKKQKEIAEQLNLKQVDPKEIHKMDCDIFSPCALGLAVNSNTLRELKCQIVAGGANNQLEEGEVTAQALVRQNILYAPDYIINAGGVINIYVQDILKKRGVMSWILKIGENLGKLFLSAAKERVSPLCIANRKTEEKIRNRH
jgi:leucine dehydrogenase